MDEVALALFDGGYDQNAQCSTVATVERTGSVLHECLEVGEGLASALTLFQPGDGLLNRGVQLLLVYWHISFD